MRDKKHGDQAHSWPTFCYELSRNFLTAPHAYDPATFHRGRCEKHWRDGKLATSSIKKQRSDKKLMQNGNDIGYDRRQIHSREGGDNHAVPLARRHGLYTPRLTGRGSVVPDMWGQAHRLRSSSSPSVHPQWACACRL